MCSKTLNKVNTLGFQKQGGNEEHDVQYEYVFCDLRDIVEHFKNLR